MATLKMFPTVPRPQPQPRSAPPFFPVPFLSSDLKKISRGGLPSRQAPAPAIRDHKSALNAVFYYYGVIGEEGRGWRVGLGAGSEQTEEGTEWE